MGIRKYDHESYPIEDPVKIKRVKLVKDEKELNDLCKYLFIHRLVFSINLNHLYLYDKDL